MGFFIFISMRNNKIEKIVELSRIIKDTPYAFKTYLQTYDNTVKKFVPLELFEDQIQLIKDYENHNENITKKYRQAGVTTVTAAWISKKLQLAKKESPERVLVIANKKETAVELANKIRAFLVQWPDWMNVGFSADKNSESRFRLNNGSEVKAVATSNDALRGFTPTILIFDEAAYIEAGSDFWSASVASLSTGGKIILVSTPNGQDPIYFPIYDQAMRGMNNFHITDLRWYKDPRYTKDLRWIKTKDIVHYMLNRTMYDDNEISLIENDKTKFDNLIENGYKPYSSWFESMCKKFKYNKRTVAQEIENDFLASGDSVISSEIITNISKNMVQEPIEKHMSGLLWVWKEPVIGHRYIASNDVSRGDSEDYSSLNIIDFDTQEQVLEYIGKIPPDDLAAITYKWAKIYGEAFVVIDITGGMGVATSRKMQEYNYKNLFIEGVNANNKWEYNPKLMDKIPGLNFNNKRVQIIASFEEHLRNGFYVRSARLINELNTFVYINGRPDHMKGCHDDSIMSLSMALYIGDLCFNQLSKNENINKAMIDSWVVNETSYDINKSIYNQNNNNGILNGNNNIYHKDNPMNISKKTYDEFSWLFNTRKK